MSSSYQIGKEVGAQRLLWRNLFFLTHFLGTLTFLPSCWIEPTTLRLEVKVFTIWITSSCVKTPLILKIKPLYEITRKKRKDQKSQDFQKEKVFAINLFWADICFSLSNKKNIFPFFVNKFIFTEFQKKKILKLIF